MNQNPFDPCQFAVERHKNLARWRNLWTILLFVFGTTVILFLCASILLFINESWLPGAISTVGTIVNGAGVGWVVARRDEAKKEEEAAYEDVKNTCRPAPGAVGYAPTALTESVQEAERYRNKLKLFGRWL